jgi:alpha-D-xyloside xylohydrolase
MRPLFADFAADKRVWNMTDEFLFGRSILACPIVNAQYTEEKIIRTDAMTGWDRQTASDGSPVGTIDFSSTKTATKYLPKGAVWYDFWTGKAYKGGQTVTLETSLNRVPMFVRAGSILPLGPEMQYVGEKSWDNIELRLYPGADGSFTLYEDEGDSYRYEQGVCSTVTFRWNDRRRTLTIGERKGRFPGMLQQRRFTVVTPDGRRQQVSYDGQPVEVRL